MSMAAMSLKRLQHRMWESHDVIGQWFCCAVQGSRLRSQGSKLELVESESLWSWAKTFLPTDLMWSWLVGTIMTQTDSNPMWWFQLRECFLSINKCLVQSNRKECHAMCVTSLWWPSGFHMSINQYIYIYIYIYQDCTIDNSNDHKRHLKRQVRFELSIPIAANSTLKLWLGCYSVSWRNIPQSLGMIHPGRLPMSIDEALDWYLWELIS